MNYKKKYFFLQNFHKSLKIDNQSNRKNMFNSGKKHWLIIASNFIVTIELVNYHVRVSNIDYLEQTWQLRKFKIWDIRVKKFTY